MDVLVTFGRCWCWGGGQEQDSTCCCSAGFWLIPQRTVSGGKMKCAAPASIPQRVCARASSCCCILNADWHVVACPCCWCGVNPDSYPGWTGFTLGSDLDCRVWLGLNWFLWALEGLSESPHIRLLPPAGFKIYIFLIFLSGATYWRGLIRFRLLVVLNLRIWFGVFMFHWAFLGFTGCIGLGFSFGRSVCS